MVPLRLIAGQYTALTSLEFYRLGKKEFIFIISALVLSSREITHSNLCKWLVYLNNFLWQEETEAEEKEVSIQLLIINNQPFQFQFLLGFFSVSQFFHRPSGALLLSVVKTLSQFPELCASIKD